VFYPFTRTGGRKREKVNGGRKREKREREREREREPA